ncbi:MAG TPA: phosphatidylglycerophosphatase A [Candidatus Acidoferrum sp.]|jgi:phosphatidylglycerophosphatase A|nr:phosphatidylglycerophosphatase A [Candidatus Acidoferrum sp.]
METAPNAKTVAAPTSASSSRKPFLSLFIATACGLGYIPVAPGTFGSLAGLALALSAYQVLTALGLDIFQIIVVGGTQLDFLLIIQCVIVVVVAVLGVWTATRASRYWQQKDPQSVVIDEVSGQHLALLLGSALPVWWRTTNSWAPPKLGFITYQSPLGWKYLLLGFILFRAFDIWKPFPARQAESLPGGLGIMADDWIAGIYTALAIWLARAFGF